MDIKFKKLNIHSGYFTISRGKTFRISLIVVVILALIGSGFLYFQYQKTAKELKKVKSQVTITQGAKDDEVKKIVSEVSKIAKLPENETPSIATITDVSKLKDQPFFKNAQNGDILLVYNNSGKAILYDPKDKKIVDVTTLSTTASFNQQFKVAIRNGTATPNLTGKLEEDLKKTLGVVNVVSKENAQKQTYEKTIVIVLNKEATEFALNVARALNVQTADMPADEPKPQEVDVLVIIGKDRAR